MGKRQRKDMFRKAKDKNKPPKAQRKASELEGLEKSVIEKLEETGLVFHAKIHNGDLEDNRNYEEPGNSVYLEYRLNREETQDPEKPVLGHCKLLRDYIFEALTEEFPEIRGIEYYKAHEGRVLRTRLLLNREADIYNIEHFTMQFLSRLDNALSNYIGKYSKKV